MVSWNCLLAIFLFSLLITPGCLQPPAVNKENAGYLAGIRFLEKNPTETAGYTVKDMGGDVYIVYFNVTSPGGVQTGFAEYYVDKRTKDVYTSPTYATAIAVVQNPDLKKLSERYTGGKTDPFLIKTDNEEGRRYVWEIKVIAEGVNIAVFRFDAVEEKILGVKFGQTDTIKIYTG